MINMGEIFAYPRISDLPMERVQISEGEAKKFLLNPGDLLFARQSLVLSGAGKCSIFLGASEPITFEGHLIRVRLNEDIACPTFYYYFFGSVAGRQVIESIIEQVAAAGVRGSDLAKLLVPYPPLPEQCAIAYILGTLDDKIELNRRMNETLEAMAQALFKNWFVDFEPVRAKAEGRDPGLPKEIVDIFPARFDYSELGEIPAGWRMAKLGEVLSVIETGGRPKGGVKDITDGIPSVGAESIVGIGHFDYSKTKFVPFEFFEAMTKGHVQDGDVLLYKDGGRPGEFEPHVTMAGEGFPFSEFCINEHVYRLRTDSALPQHYLYFSLSSDSAKEEMRNRGTGVAVPGLNSAAVRELAILLPSQLVLRTFERRSTPLIQQIFVNCNESRTLAAIRETLLPKLLSGEIRVKDAERFLESRL